MQLFNKKKALDIPNRYFALLILAQVVFSSFPIREGPDTEQPSLIVAGIILIVASIFGLLSAFTGSPESITLYIGFTATGLTFLVNGWTAALNLLRQCHAKGSPTVSGASLQYADADNIVCEKGFNNTLRILTGDVIVMFFITGLAMFWGMALRTHVMSDGNYSRVGIKTVYKRIVRKLRKSKITLQITGDDQMLVDENSFRDVLRAAVRSIVDAASVQVIVMLLVLVDGTIAVLTIVGTTDSSDSDIEALSLTLTSLFILEVLLRMYGYGTRKFFSMWMNVFDFVVVFVAGAIEIVNAVSDIDAFEKASGVVLLRVVRVARILRLFVQLERVQFSERDREPRCFYLNAKRKDRAHLVVSMPVKLVSEGGKVSRTMKVDIFNRMISLSRPLSGMFSKVHIPIKHIKNMFLETDDEERIASFDARVKGFLLSSKKHSNFRVQFKTKEERDYIMGIIRTLVKTLNPSDAADSQLVLYSREKSGKDLMKNMDKFTLFVGTWNMGDAPPPGNIREWIMSEEYENYDLYSIGVQECSMRGSMTRVVEDVLGPNYVLVAERNMGPIRNMVFARKSVAPNITHVETYHEATGVGGVLYNKGGAGIAFRYNGLKFCFVSAHLAAHQELVANRNRDAATIIRELQFGSEFFDIANEYNLFFYGDLNYRLDLDRDSVIQHVESGDVQPLMKFDQLVRERSAGHVFHDFREGVIKFNPTYKYKVGEYPREYTTQKMRVPSYTDRIMWRCLPYTNVEQKEYGASDSVVSSDHSPIYSTFDVLLPKPPRMSDAFTYCFIEVGSLTLMDPHKRNDDGSIMNEGIGPQPMAMVYVPFLDSTLRSSLSSTVAVGSTSFATFGPFLVQPRYLESQILLVRMLDGNDMIGQARVPLGEACIRAAAMSKDAVPFSSELQYYGHLAGSLEGSVRIHFTTDFTTRLRSLTKKGSSMQGLVPSNV